MLDAVFTRARALAGLARAGTGGSARGLMSGRRGHAATVSGGPLPGSGAGHSRRGQGSRRMTRRGVVGRRATCRRDRPGRAGGVDARRVARRSNTPTEYNTLTQQNFLETCTNYYFDNTERHPRRSPSNTVKADVTAPDQNTCQCQYEVFAGPDGAETPPMPINSTVAKEPQYAGYTGPNFTTLNADLKADPRRPGTACPRTSRTQITAPARAPTGRPSTTTTTTDHRHSAPTTTTAAPLSDARTVGPRSRKAAWLASQQRDSALTPRSGPPATGEVRRWTSACSVVNRSHRRPTATIVVWVDDAGGIDTLYGRRRHRRRTIPVARSTSFWRGSEVVDLHRVDERDPVVDQSPDRAVRRGELARD